MAVNVRKLRSTIKQIHEEMKKDPKLRKAVKANHVRVLKERGLNFAEIVKAHDLHGCPGTSTVPCSVLTLVRAR